MKSVRDIGDDYTSVRECRQGVKHGGRLLPSHDSTYRRRGRNQRPRRKAHSVDITLFYAQLINILQHL